MYLRVNDKLYNNNDNNNNNNNNNNNDNNDNDNNDLKFEGHFFQILAYRGSADLRGTLYISNFADSTIFSFNPLLLIRHAYGHITTDAVKERRRATKDSFYLA